MPKFRILSGCWIDDGSVHKELENKSHRAGEVIESMTALDGKFNSPGYPPKFERITEGVPTVALADIRQMPGESAEQWMARIKKLSEPSTLSPGKLAGAEGDDVAFQSMTVEELRAFAAEEEIDLGRATRKEDIIRVLKEATLVTA